MTESARRIDPEAVDAVFRDCLYTEDELSGARNGEAVFAQGITGKFGFHPERLKSHADEVRAWLALLPRQFRKSEGGGWTFLNACNQDDGHQWTGLHQRMDQLFTLGIALGLAQWQLPREMWDILPGGMPYVCVNL